MTIFRRAIPAFFRFTDVTELMWQEQYYTDGECRNKRERRFSLLLRHSHSIVIAT